MSFIANIRQSKQLELKQQLADNTVQPQTQSLVNHLLMLHLQGVFDEKSLDEQLLVMILGVSLTELNCRTANQPLNVIRLGKRDHNPDNVKCPASALNVSRNSRSLLRRITTRFCRPSNRSSANHPTDRSTWLSWDVHPWNDAAATSNLVCVSRMLRTNDAEHMHSAGRCKHHIVHIQCASRSKRMGSQCKRLWSGTFSPRAHRTTAAVCVHSVFRRTAQLHRISVRLAGNESNVGVRLVKV